MFYNVFMDWRIKHIFYYSIGIFALCIGGANAASARNYMSPTTYNNMAPFMNNRMRSDLRPDSADYAPNPTSAYARAAVGSGNTPNSAFISAQNTARRRVVARSASNTAVARSGVRATGATLNTNRSTPNIDLNRRVVARSGRGSANNTATAQQPITTGTITSARCMADYENCMNAYCARPDTMYNRCYCSGELTRIETTLRPSVEEVLRQLVILKGGGSVMSDAELEELWQNTFYEYLGTNDMANLNDALNITWPDESENMRGQNAFNIGHEYCVQHLTGCFYMASNLRDVYRSGISRDCATYENYLNKIKRAGEMVLDSAGAE